MEDDSEKQQLVVLTFNFVFRLQARAEQVVSSWCC